MRALSSLPGDVDGRAAQDPDGSRDLITIIIVVTITVVTHNNSNDNSNTNTTTTTNDNSSNDTKTGGHSCVMARKHGAASRMSGDLPSKTGEFATYYRLRFRR